MIPDRVRGRPCERGSELACQPELARRLKIDIGFCDPHARRPRGSNENTNGLLRPFMAKGTDLSDAAQTWLNDVARLMNGRPRKTLGWKTPRRGHGRGNQNLHFNRCTCCSRPRCMSCSD